MIKIDEFSSLIIFATSPVFEFCCNKATIKTRAKIDKNSITLLYFNKIITSLDIDILGMCALLYQIVPNKAKRRCYYAQKEIPVSNCTIRCSSTLALLVPSISAKEAAKPVDPNAVARQETVGSEVVQILNDGRIKGIQHPEKLNEQNRKNILKLLNFTDKDIADYPDELEFSLLREGGRKVTTNTSNYQHTFTKDGVTQVVNDSLEASYPASQEEVSALGMGGESGGAWSGKGVLTYLGTTTNEYKYKYRTTFN